MIIIIISYSLGKWVGGHKIYLYKNSAQDVDEQRINISFCTDWVFICLIIIHPLLKVRELVIVSNKL